jgi:hypothetical protein
MLRFGSAKTAGSLLLLTGLLFSASPPSVADVVRPVEDGVVRHEIRNEADPNDDEYFVHSVDGQWWPRVHWHSSPPSEERVVFEYDLSAYGDQPLAAVRAVFYARNAWCMDNVRIEVLYGEGNGTVGTEDFADGAQSLGNFAWDAPTAGVLENNIDKYLVLQRISPRHQTTGTGPCLHRSI